MKQPNNSLAQFEQRPFSFCYIYIVPGTDLEGCQVGCFMAQEKEGAVVPE